MAIVNWSASAKRDLVAIGDYYDKSSPKYAKLIVERLFDAVSILKQFPAVGRRVPELELDAFRELIVEAYRIVYLLDDGEENVEILAVVHSRQDMLKKLSREK